MSIAPLDGRRHRPSSLIQSVQINVDVPPETKELVIRASVDFNMPMKQFVAEACENYLAHLQSGMRPGVRDEVRRLAAEIQRLVEK